MSISNKPGLSLKGKGLLIASFSFLFFIFAFGAGAQTLDASVWGKNNWQDPISVEQGTPLQLRWNFPGALKCKFEENPGFPFSSSGTVSVPAYRSAYNMTCCMQENIWNNCISFANDSVTINVSVLPAGDQIYWDYNFCDNQTNCQGMFSSSGGYTQANAQMVYNKLWSSSILPHSWNSSLNAEIGLLYDPDEKIGFVQLVSLDGSWKRGIVYSYKDQKVFLASAEGNWGDDSFLRCYPQITSGANRGVWAPLGRNPGGNMPTIYSQASKRSVCDLFGAAHPNAYDVSGGWQAIRWYNDLTIGWGNPIPGWSWFDIFIMRMDGIHAIPTVDYKNWWFETPTHYECTESKTCQIASGSGPSCSSDAECEFPEPLPDLKAFCNAIPNSGVAPLNVSVEAWTEGTAQGDITYRFDCKSDNNWSAPVIVSQDPANPSQGTLYTATCNYILGNTYTAKVEASRSGLTKTVSCPAVIVSGPSVPPAPTLKGRSTDPSLSEGPIAISSGNSVILDWRPTNSPTSCTASAVPANTQWSGLKAIGGGNQTITNVTVSTVFTLSCTNAGGTLSDPFEARVLNATLTPNPSSGTAGSTNFNFTANVTAGIIPGNTFKYQFYCNSTDATPAYTSPDIAASSFTPPSPICIYSTSGTKTAKVIVSHSQAQKTALASLIVNATGNLKIILDPSIIKVGDNVQAEARYYPAGSDIGQPVTDDCDWDSTDDLIATVDGGGLVTGISPGESYIVARYINVDEGIDVSDDAKITVMFTPTWKEIIPW